MILVTGSLAFDYIMNFPGRFGDHILADRIHILNVSFLVDKLKKERGGTAANIAYNLALLGERPVILATAGNDFGEYKSFLQQAGVDVTMIQIIRTEPTASAYIITDRDDNQISGFYPGAMGASLKFKIQNSKFKIKMQNAGADWRGILVVISPNEPRAMMNYVRECQELGVDYLFDPGMQLPRLKAADVRLGVCGARIVIGNDYEMNLINSKFEARNSKQIQMTKIQNPKQIWVTTLGGRGSLVEKRDEKGKMVEKVKVRAARPKNVSDPTGAGDAYRAGFLTGYVRGFDLETCAKMGSVCAVYTVEKYGTTTHKFTVDEFCQRYSENYGGELKL